MPNAHSLLLGAAPACAALHRHDRMPSCLVRTWQHSSRSRLAYRCRWPTLHGQCRSVPLQPSVVVSDYVRAAATNGNRVLYGAIPYSDPVRCAVQRLFTLFDTKHDLHLDLLELLAGLVPLLKGTDAQRAAILFALLDVNDDGVLDEIDLSASLRQVCKAKPGKTKLLS